MKAFTFILGLAVGYTLGTRRGRQGYEDIKDRATQLWQNRRVQDAVGGVQRSVNRVAPAASGAVSSVVDKANEKAADAASAATPAEELPGNV